MAEPDCTDCRCSNISIMQLFHELKQRYPTVPDQIVSKVIQQNFHDKTACETILNKESHSYVQCYPGAIISGDGRPASLASPLLDHCSAPTRTQSHRASLPTADSEAPLIARDLSACKEHPELSHQRIRRNSVEGQSGSNPATGKDGVTSRQQTASDVSSRLPHTPTSDCDRPSTVCHHEISDENPAFRRSLSFDPSRCLPVDNDTLSADIRVSEPDLSPRKIDVPKATLPGSTVSKPRTLSLEKKIELSKIPLSQLVREARERLHKSCSAVSDSVSQTSTPLSSNSDVSTETVQRLTTDTKEEQEKKLNAEVPSIVNQHSISGSDEISGGVADSRIRIPELNCDNPSLPPSHLENDLSSPLRISKTPVQASHISLFTSPPPPPPPPPTENVARHRLPSNHSDSTHRHDSRNVPEQPVASSQDYRVAVECLVCPGESGNRQRSFTSVNVTLRPPSTEPIEASSGPTIMYTTAHFDRKQGYQSQLQIRIGRAGGTMTAFRSRVCSPMPRPASRSPCRAGAPCHSKPHLRELLQKQKKRKDMLARELHREREKLRNMQIQVRAMKEALARKPSPFILSQLKSEIDDLRNDCERLTAAVDLYSGQGNYPLGETNEDFYRNIYTGQRPQRSGWSCRVCTFRNHPLLTVCEECEMPRLSIGTSCDHLVARVSNPIPNNNSSCAAEETSTSVSRTVAPLQEQ